VIDPAPAIPTVAELLAEPQFQPLNEWLRERAADVSGLQALVDQMLELAQQKASERKT